MKNVDPVLIETLRRVDTDDPSAAIFADMTRTDTPFCRFGSGDWKGISTPRWSVAGYGETWDEAAENWLRRAYDTLEGQTHET